MYFAAVGDIGFPGPGDPGVHGDPLRALGFTREEFKQEPA